MTADTAEREAFERLVTSAKMLLQNAVGCAVNHYGEDYAIHGEPGWIADCRADIDRAANLMQARAALPARAPEELVSILRHARAVIASLSGGPEGSCASTIQNIDAMLSAAPPPPEQGGEDRDICPVCAEPLITGQECATDIEMGTCHATCLEGTPIVDLETGEPCDGPADTFPYEPETTEPLASPAPGPAEPEPFSDDWSFPHPEKRLIGKVVTSGPAEPKEARAWGTESDARRRLRKEVLTLLHYAASGNMKQSIDDAYLGFIAPLLPPDEPQPGPAEPVLKVLRREVQHYIECSDNGLSLVPRGLLTRILSALQPPQPAPAPVAAQPQPSAWPVASKNVNRPAVWIVREILDVLRKDKFSSGTVVSGLLRQPMKDFVPLYSAPPPASDERVAAMRERCAALAAQERHGRVGSENAFNRGAVSASANIENAIRTLPLDGEG